MLKTTRRQTSFSFAVRIGIALRAAALAVLCTAAPAAAAPITVVVGTFSFDQLIPADGTAPGTTDFGVWNLTGTGVDIDGTGIVLPSLTFSDVTATLFDGTESTPLTLTLGDVAPGPLVDSTGFTPAFLQFADTQPFASATLTGHIAAFTATLVDGSIFVAPDSLFVASLAPLDGQLLVAGRDVVSVAISGDLTASNVPEPGTLVLLAAGLAAGASRRFATSRRSRQP